MPPPNRLSFQGVNTIFKEPIWQILTKIKRRPYFRWPPKMLGDPSARNSTSRCSYHRDFEHLTEDCKVYKSFLEQLVRDGHLEEFIDRGAPGVSVRTEVEVP